MKANMFIKAYVLESISDRTAGAMDAAIELIDKSEPDATEHEKEDRFEADQPPAQVAIDDGFLWSLGIHPH